MLILSMDSGDLYKYGKNEVLINAFRKLIFTMFGTSVVSFLTMKELKSRILVPLLPRTIKRSHGLKEKY